MKLGFASYNLKAQSLFLVGLLLAGELLFVSVLVWQLRETESEIAREAHLKDIFRRSQTLVYMLNDYQEDLESWFKTRDAKVELAIAKKENEMSEACAWLEENLKEFPELRAQVIELEDLQEKLFKIVRLSKKVLASMTEKMQLFAFVQRFSGKGESIRREWEHKSVNLLHDEEGLLDTFPELQQRRRESLRFVICCGLAGNILSVALLAVFFVRSISSRLALLVENTKRISAKSALLRPISGSDEIASLDASMHEMADAIETAQRERQAFLAMVSHELRTPLMSVSATFELLSAGLLGKLGDSASEIADESEMLLQRLLSLINDLLDLEKLEAGKISFQKKVFYLESAIEKAIERVADRACARRVLISDLECDTEIECDLERFVQALSNILLNAVQHAPEKSTVEISVTESENAVEIAVMDSGVGVPAELEKHLFERFRKEPGSEKILKGMGLPIASKLISGMGGSLAYEARPEGGAKFTIKMSLLSSR